MANIESITPTHEVELGTARGEVAAPFAAAIRAHNTENWPQLLGVQHIADGKMNWVNTAVWFGQDVFREQIIDRLIAARIQGPVLDVGAGAGRMTLKLQAADIDVVALDCEPACVEVLNAQVISRGWNEPRKSSCPQMSQMSQIFSDENKGLAGSAAVLSR